jgi:hypothetical protein
MFAPVVNVYIPVAILNKNRRILMTQIPSYIVVIILIFRRFNRQRKILTAQSGTFLALIFLAHTQQTPNNHNAIY